MGRPRSTTYILSRLGVVAFLVLPAGTFAQTQNDHLKCYQIKDTLSLGGTADLDTPQFGVDPGCTISKAKLFCVPGTKTNVIATDTKTKIPITPLPVSGPDPGDRICYKIKCPKPAVPIADQPVTDQFGNRTITKFKTSLICTPAFKGSARFVDNGDGTVTDNYTGLQWEQKDNLGALHDVDNAYYWSLSGTAPDGPAFTNFLGTLNNCTSSDGTAVTNAGFAGHCDWRLPTIQELQTIVDADQANCGVSGACIDPIFGLTIGGGYASATTLASDPSAVWFINFFNSAMNSYPKSNFSEFYVRAVRVGS